MKRKEEPSAERASAETFEEAVRWWLDYPPMGAGTEAEDAWSTAWHDFCDRNGVDSTAATSEADRRGWTDQPWDQSAI